MIDTSSRYGVIGHPIAHSLSPRLHQPWLNRIGGGTYGLFDVAPDALKNIKNFVARENLKGFNVTVPHKETIMAYLDRVAPQARRIGAVNTVRVEDDGALVGFNTDGLGFLAPLKKLQGILQRPVLVIGAGGAARAVVAALLTTDVPLIMIHNRTLARAKGLADDLGSGRASLVDDLDLDDAVAAAGLIVNTTSLGMTGQPTLKIDLSRAAGDAVAYDIVYRPLETDFLAAARHKSLATLDGLDMLIAQGAEAFRIWTGETADQAAARADLMAYLESNA